MLSSTESPTNLISQYTYNTPIPIYSSNTLLMLPQYNHSSIAHLIFSQCSHLMFPHTHPPSTQSLPGHTTTVYTPNTLPVPKSLFYLMHPQYTITHPVLSWCSPSAVTQNTLNNPPVVTHPVHSSCSLSSQSPSAHLMLSQYKITHPILSQYTLTHRYLTLFQYTLTNCSPCTQSLTQHTPNALPVHNPPPSAYLMLSQYTITHLVHT